MVRGSGPHAHAPAIATVSTDADNIHPGDMCDRSSAIGENSQASTVRRDVGMRDWADGSVYIGLDDSDGQPFMYPIPFNIRNTFIDCSAPSPSLREFYQERKLRSAPGSRTLVPGSSCIEASPQVYADSPTSVVSETESGADAHRESTEDASEYNLSNRYWDRAEATPRSPDTTGQPFFFHSRSLPRACMNEMTDESQCYYSKVSHVDSATHANPPPSARFALLDLTCQTIPDNLASVEIGPCSEGHSVHAACMPAAATVSFELPSTATIGCPRRTMIKLGDVLVEQKIVSPALPTMGSVGHAFGNCKPCAFVHTKGCSSGVACQFCHLCEPGEKKRRRKDVRRGIRQQAS